MPAHQQRQCPAPPRARPQLPAHHRALLPTGTRSASRSDAPAPWAYRVTGGTQSWRSSMQRYVVFGHDCRGRLLQYLRTSTERIHDCGPWFPVGYHRDPR